jgi:phage anti-repressor protein
MLPVVLCFGAAFLLIAYLIHLQLHPKKEAVKRRKNNWIEQRNTFFEHMDWLQVDCYTAEEMYSKLKTYKELLNTNKELKKHISKREKV